MPAVTANVTKKPVAAKAKKTTTSTRTVAQDAYVKEQCMFYFKQALKELDVVDYEHEDNKVDGRPVVGDSILSAPIDNVNSSADTTTTEIELPL